MPTQQPDGGFVNIQVSREAATAMAELGERFQRTPGEMAELAWSLYLRDFPVDPELIPALRGFVALLSEPKNDVEEAVRESLLKIILTYIRT